MLVNRISWEAWMFAENGKYLEQFVDRWEKYWQNLNGSRLEIVKVFSWIVIQVVDAKVINKQWLTVWQRLYHLSLVYWSWLLISVIGGRISLLSFSDPPDLNCLLTFILWNNNIQFQIKYLWYKFVFKLGCVKFKCKFVDFIIVLHKSD